MSTPLDSALLQAARLWIGHHRPYYAAALYRCAIVPSHDTGTMAVDEHWRIYVNPEFANSLSVTRFAAALVHEINHLIRDHAARSRMQGATSTWQRRRWNLAGDAELNDDLLADGLDVDKQHWIFPSTFRFKNDLTAEIYYRQLEKLEEEAGGAKGRDKATSDGSSADSGTVGRECGSGAGGVKHDFELPPDDAAYPGVSQREGDMVRADVATAVLDYQRSQGNAPDDLVAWAQGVLNPKVDWRRVLGSMVRQAVAVVSDDGDHTYRRFARRSSSLPHVRLPGLQRHVAQVAVVIDTSGSMSQDDLDRAVSEVRGILRSSSVADDAVTVLAVDVMVHEVQHVTNAANVRLKGRGGTDMRVGLEAAVNLKPRPDIVVVLTDGYTDWPEVPLRIPVIAGIIENQASMAPWPRPPAWIRCVVIDD